MPKRARGVSAHEDGREIGENGRQHDHPQDDTWVESAFASRYTSQPVPKDKLPEKSMPAPVAYQLIRDMRQLDSNPRLNLASFVTTWMEPEAGKLIEEALNVNFVDMEEYPSSTEIHNRCVNMLANLYHAPKPTDSHHPVAVKTATPLLATGTATIGSSEAIMLAGLAMKKRWEAKRKAQGKPTDKPNLVMGYNVQVCWEKFTRYFDVEERFVDLEEDCFVLTPEKAIKLVDENTIGICAILGSTYTGEFEDIEGLDKAVEKLNKEKKWEVPIHVDAASGGFVAPFTQPDLKWDFRLKNVASINVSGHKYGLVYPGVGWVIWRTKENLPEAIVFHTNYLGSDQPNFTLNFSKGASMIIAQYYQFIRLGFEGYRKIMINLMAVAKRLELGILGTGHFTILSNDKSLPLVAFSLKKKLKEGDGQKETDETRSYNEFDIADKLRVRGWVLPAYTMAPNARNVRLLRAVIREDLSMSMVDELVTDIQRAVDWLDHHHTYTDDQLAKLTHTRFHVVDNSNHNNPHRKKKHNAGVC
ncbi:hypothetical protein WJX72_000821 [[Myrmecia] bisecta]|uniref:Glutamate decarboxylase n=1 Tax=[Myrmecia] bisecta TaxID=41462 RepID=A0AAW1R4G0_9CHLO